VFKLMSADHLDKTGVQISTDCYVRKTTGDAQYAGWVVSCYTTLNGKPRCVVDVEPQRFQMICAPHLLEVLAIDSSE